MVVVLVLPPLCECAPLPDCPMPNFFDAAAPTPLKTALPFLLNEMKVCVFLFILNKIAAQNVRNAYLFIYLFLVFIFEFEWFTTSYTL